MSQMWICIDECVVQFSVIIKEWSSDSISLKDLLIGVVVTWFWFEHQIYFNLAKEWIEDLWNIQWIFGYELVINPFFFTFFVFFVHSFSLKVCDGNSSGLWRFESVKFHQFVVCWSFWRLLNLILVNFET